MTVNPTKKTDGSKHPGGRPRKEIDLELVEKLGQIHCSDMEIAAICGVSYETFMRRKREESFAALLEESRARGKASLRRLQWQMAQNGNATMALWLGKQLLGQRDRFDDVVDNKAPLPWED